MSDVKPVDPPWDMSTLPISAAGIEAIRQTVACWLEWQEAAWTREGFVADDDAQVRQMPYYPTRRSLKAWIAELDLVIERTANDEGKEPRRATMPRARSK